MSTSKVVTHATTSDLLGTARYGLFGKARKAASILCFAAVAATAAPMRTVDIDLWALDIAGIGNTLGCSGGACPDRVYLQPYMVPLSMTLGATIQIYPGSSFYVGLTGPTTGPVYLTFDRPMEVSLGGLPWQTGTLMQNGLVTIGTQDVLGFNNGPTMS